VTFVRNISYSQENFSADFRQNRDSAETCLNITGACINLIVDFLSSNPLFRRENFNYPPGNMRLPLGTKFLKNS